MKYQFNELAQQNIDFTNEDLVKEYDGKQKATILDGLRLAKELEVKPQDSIIEFGPGTGALSIAMAKMCEHVYAVDTSSAMLEYITKSAKDNEVRNISTHHAGFLSYEHDGQPVDLIVTKFAFHHLPDMWKAVALTNFNKTLKMNGRVYIHDVIFSFEPENHQASIDKWIDEVTRTSGWSREEFLVHVNEEYSTFSWILEALIRKAGFKIVRSHYWSEAYGSILCRKVRELNC
ncbi:MAG: class I SAM-dependent methyltransferase [Deinococcota bacterium]